MEETPNINIVEQYFKESGIPYEKSAIGSIFASASNPKIGIAIRGGKYLLNINPYYYNNSSPFYYYWTADVVEAYIMLARYYFEDTIDTKFIKKVWK